MKKFALIINLLALSAVIILSSYRHIKSVKTGHDLSLQPGGIIKVDDKLTIVTGGGGNSGILVTDKGVIVIDTKMKANAEDLYKLAKEKAGSKKIIVINTHYHMDHTGGNSFYKGDKIYIGDYDKSFLEKQLKPEDMTTDFVKDKLTLNMGDEVVEIYNMGQAHTFKDMVVYLKNRKILFAGDLVFDKVNPVLKRESGANVDKWLAVLKSLLTKFDFKTVVPGHGANGGKDIIENQIGYFEDMKMAALNPDKAKDLEAKYGDYMAYPNMCSPELTVQYIKETR